MQLNSVTPLEHCRRFFPTPPRDNPPRYRETLGNNTRSTRPSKTQGRATP
jgi:hypothetical protein